MIKPHVKVGTSFRILFEVCNKRQIVTCTVMIKPHVKVGTSFRILFEVCNKRQIVKPKSESKVPKSRPKGLGRTLKSHGPPPPK